MAATLAVVPQLSSEIILNVTGSVHSPSIPSVSLPSTVQYLPKTRRTAALVLDVGALRLTIQNITGGQRSPTRMPVDLPGCPTSGWAAVS